MKKQIISISLMLSVVLLIISMIGFKAPVLEPEKIEDTFFVLTMAIDKGIENDKNIRVTVLREKPSESINKGSQSQGREAEVKSAEGQTVFEAIRNLSLTNNEKIFLGQLGQIVISDELAKDDIVNFIDFIIKDHETRLDVNLLIAKETTGEKILRNGEKNKQFIPSVIEGLINISGQQSLSRHISILNVITTLDDKYTDSYLPSIEIVTSKDIEGKEESNIELNGFAIFNDTKLIGFISNGTARGLNWLDDKVLSCIIVVKDDTDKGISLEIVGSNIKKKIEFNGALPEATINIEVKSNIGEQMSQNYINNRSALKVLEQKEEDYIKKEIDGVIKYSQENDVDILGMGDKVYHKYPLKWESINYDWRAIFKKMRITVNVKAKIVKSYHASETIKTEKGEKNANNN